MPNASVSSGLPRASVAVRLRRVVLTGAMFAALGALLYAKGVPCLFARILHTPCPACGSTRAVVALFAGDLHGVLHYNPLGPVAALLLGALAVQSLGSLFVHGDFRGAGEGRFGRVARRALYLVAAAELVLWIARFFGALGGPVPV